MRKWYDYLIAYRFNQEGYLTACDGTMQLSRLNKITTFEEVNSVVEFITNKHEGASNVSVYNIVYLGRNKH